MIRLPALLLSLTAASLAPAIAADQSSAPSTAAPTQHLVLREKNWHRALGAGSADKVGAIAAGTGDIFDETGTTQVGKLHLTFSNTEVKDGKVVSIFSSGLFRLKDGDIAVETVVDVEGDARNKQHRYVVTGGTGAYLGVRGYGINRFDVEPSYQEMWLTR